MESLGNAVVLQKPAISIIPGRLRKILGASSITGNSKRKLLKEKGNLHYKREFLLVGPLSS